MFRKLSIFWIVVSVLMLAVAYSGVADSLLQSASSCGADGETARACRDGEIPHVLAITGWISLAVGLVELTVLPKVKGALTF